jgi:rod shape-determining protein MreC
MRRGWHLPLQRDVGVLILLVILSVSIIALDRLSEENSVIGLLSKAFSPFTDLSSRIMNVSSVYNDNLILRSNLMEMARENAVLREYVHEIDRLRHLLDFSENHPEELRCSRVVHQLETRMGGGIVLNKGSASELKKNMTVICPEGLVGRIVRVRRYTSLVKRVIDPGYRVSALTQRTRATGILGTGDRGRLVMEWVSPNTEVARGDTVISSGLGSITPKGILIGRVVDISEKPESFSLSLEVEPFVDFDRLEEVFVLMKEPPDYRSLLEERSSQR